MPTIIEKRLYLEPKYLDQNLKNHILRRITEITKNECNKEYGHILSINRLLSFENIEDTIFTVRFEAETFKPEANKIYKGTICMIYKNGNIFIDIAGRQKMLIPISVLKSYVFDSKNVVYKKGDMTMSKGDEVKVKVTAAEYKNRNFLCYGSLV